MYLKKLDIKGFKSFADTTEINFFPGINIIVGPNGCGKSNIVDTVRWVLGEANVRNLRGQRNEDIIFSGTDQKRALGMANVTMIIDNADRGLPTDYGEVAVGRKVFRNGESEFYINKSRVRLKDISGLFAGTGLGKKGYSIIGQGELEQVLNGQPFDRRLLLEEASGIIKHRQQRDEVISRMAATGNDMEKLEAYLSSLAERREELMGKAERARAFQTQRQVLQGLQKAVLEHECAETQRKYREKNAELTGVAAEEALLADKIKAAEEGAKLRENQQEELRRQIDELREERHRLEKAIDKLEAERRLQQERKRNASLRQQALNAENERYERTQKRLEADIRQAEEDYKRACSEDQGHDSGLQQVEAEMQSLEAQIVDCQREYDAYSDNQTACRQQEQGMVQELQSLRDRLLEIEEQRRMAIMYSDESVRRENDLQERIAALRGDLTQAEAETGRIQSELGILNQSRKEIQDEIGQLNQQMQALQKNRRDLASRWSLIEDQDRNYSGYSEDVKNLLRDQDLHRGQVQGIVGTVGSLIEVPAGLEQAIDVAGGRGLEDIVMESELDARRAIRYIKEKGLGRITFLPLDLLKVTSPPADLISKISALPGVVGLASALIKYDHKYRRAIEYLFGRVIIVETLDRAVEVFRKINYGFRIVSLEGDILNASGAMTGGKARRVRNSPLLRAAEKRQLEQSLKSADDQLEGLQKAVFLAEQGLQEKQLQVEALSRELAGHESRRSIFARELASRVAEMDECRKKLQSCQEQADSCQQEGFGLDQQVAGIQSRLQELREQLVKKAEEQERSSRLIDQLDRDLAVRNERREAFLQQKAMKKRELDHILAGLQQYQIQYEQDRQIWTDIKEQMLQAVKDIETSSQQGQAAAHSAVQTRGQLEALNTRMNQLNSDEQGGLDNMQTHRAGLFGLRQEQQELAAASRNLQMQKVRLEADLEVLASRWTEILGGEMPEEPQSQHQARNIREYRINIKELQESLDAIGPVDLDSIPAYEEINQRYQFVSAQYDDLVEARRGLERLLKETETIMVREFDAFLIEAGASFKRTFMEIFGGGDASLIVHEHSDRLQAGIEIVVKLPGKKVQYLNLLSGGERALTCIAFIFALLRLKPAPFCLLDEIDAALDESNLLKFTRFLKRLVGSIQFLVITHRQLTIESGDCIYGVTMPQAGISRVYSVRAEEAIDMAV